MAKQRIQKVLAAAGYGSRRACEQLVLEGRVRVNRHVVDELPVVVDLGTDKITVDGKAIRQEQLVYYMLFKPRHVVCTQRDPSGRKRAVDLMKGVRERVFPVGRLDEDSTGLLIMTNDGELAQKLTHPSFRTPKTYRVEIKGVPNPSQLERLRSGVWLSEGRTGPAQVTIAHRQREATTLEITLREGRNREIRRMLARLGHRVRRLSRIRMGKLSVRGLSPGAFRPLTPAEVKYLYGLAKNQPEEPPVSRSARGGARRGGEASRSGSRRGERTTGGRSSASGPPKKKPGSRRSRAAGKESSAKARPAKKKPAGTGTKKPSGPKTKRPVPAKKPRRRILHPD